MIQVDIFWTYAFGAMFAAAAARQIKKEAEAGKKIWESKYFMFNALYLALFFVPTAAFLLWAFPNWESMHLFHDLYDIHPLLPVVLCITNITQGMLGYFVSYLFIKKGQYYMAQVQVWIGYFIMFFILVHGWDGYGWQRFLYDSTVAPTTKILGYWADLFGLSWWAPGKYDLIGFWGGHVAITLYTMGICILPPLFYGLNKWVKEGAEADPKIPKEKVPSSFLKNSIVVLFIVFGFGLGLAGVASLICMFFTWITGGIAVTGGFAIIGMAIGLPVFLIPVYYFGMRRGKIGYKFSKLLFIEEDIA